MDTRVSLEYIVSGTEQALSGNVSCYSSVLPENGFLGFLLPLPHQIFRSA